MFETLKLKKKAETGDLPSIKALAERYRDKGDMTSALYWSGKYAKITRKQELSKYKLPNIMFFLDIDTMIKDGILSKSEYIDLLEEKAEECDDAQSLTMFALKFNGDENSFSNDRPRYFHWLKKAAELGDSDAQFLVGLLYNGDEDSMYDDADKYMYWLTKSAEQGNKSAQFFVGIRYSRDNMNGCIEDNPEKMVYWLTKSAEQGYANAQWWLGSTYCDGNLVPQDIEKGVALLKKAAEQGHESAIEALNQMGEE